jgi:hypothetical protein
MQEENRITIKFEYTDEFQNHSSQESSRQTFPDLGVDELSIIGEQLNIFLKQIGFYRKNDYIFMEDITEEEYSALADFLECYRAKRMGTDEN